jgi:hypothetical protein
MRMIFMNGGYRRETDVVELQIPFVTRASNNCENLCLAQDCGSQGWASILAAMAVEVFHHQPLSFCHWLWLTGP